MLGILRYCSRTTLSLVREAIRVRRTLARNGDISLCYEWGNCYAYGVGGLGSTTTTNGLTPNPVTALEWWRMAADKGHNPSRVLVGRAIGIGYGGGGSDKDEKQRFREALLYLSKAAEEEDPEGLYTLGICYRDGLGVAVDLQRTLKLLRRALEKGYVDAYVDIFNWRYDNNVPGVSDPTAIEVLKEGIENGSGLAMVKLGWAYYRGRGRFGLPQDRERALQLFIQSAERYRCISAMYACARIYHHIKRDSTKALHYYNLIIQYDDPLRPFLKHRMRRVHADLATLYRISSNNPIQSHQHLQIFNHLLRSGGGGGGGGTRMEIGFTFQISFQEDVYSDYDDHDNDNDDDNDSSGNDDDGDTSEGYDI